MAVSLRLQEIFPEPTPEQKDLIVASTLYVTRVEKTYIDAITEGWDAYQVDHAVDAEERRELRGMYTKIVSNARITGMALGVISGAVAGGWAGGKIGAIINPSPTVIGAGVVTGAVVGGGVGYYTECRIGLNRGLEQAAETVTRRPEYKHWKTEKYRVILPALMRSMTREEREPFNLECPMTLDFMEDPVRARDGRYYEGEMIREHLKKWDRDYPPERLAQLTEGERRQVFLLTSPLRSAKIDAAHLESHPEYYDLLYDRMKAIYNGKIRELHLSIQGLVPVRPEMAPIVRFCQRPLGSRIRLIRDMEDVVLESGISDAEQQEITDLFAEARAHPPALL